MEVSVGRLLKTICSGRMPTQYFPDGQAKKVTEKDGEIHHWDLCEECYDQLIRQFAIAPEIEEAVEFI